MLAHVAVEDRAGLALEAGNSPQMIFQHYRRLVQPKEAKAWFGIEPKETKRKLGRHKAAIKGDGSDTTLGNVVELAA